MRIGEVLKRSRTRQGIEIADVEERTKIRTKYLRALESEEWDVLPSPAYAKGFLRTYAQLLGLDADAIVDEYRRQVESELPAGPPLRLGEPDFDSELLESPVEEMEASESEFADQDDLLADAARIVVESETASVSMLQRRLRVGYTRAGRLVDMLERRGIISGYEGSKPRQVLVSMADLPRILEPSSADAPSPEGSDDGSDTQSELEPLSG